MAQLERHSSQVKHTHRYCGKRTEADPGSHALGLFTICKLFNIHELIEISKPCWFEFAILQQLQLQVDLGNSNRVMRFLDLKLCFMLYLGKVWRLQRMRELLRQ